jgi:CHAT domain-containing protein
VIASLWPITDGTACRMATAVYRNLLPDPAIALHQAVRDMRDSDPGNIVNWSAIIHTGP